VVFPAPVPPTIAMRSPVSMRRDTPRSAQAVAPWPSRPSSAGRRCSGPGYANQTSRSSTAGGRRAGAGGRASPAWGAGTTVPPFSAGVSSSANTRSPATVAACMTENFAEASRIGR
jgi:hypothetical protein